MDNEPLKFDDPSGFDGDLPPIYVSLVFSSGSGSIAGGYGACCGFAAGSSGGFDFSYAYSPPPIVPLIAPPPASALAPPVTNLFPAFNAVPVFPAAALAPPAPTSVQGPSATPGTGIATGITNFVSQCLDQCAIISYFTGPNGLRAGVGGLLNLCGEACTPQFQATFQGVLPEYPGELVFGALSAYGRIGRIVGGVEAAGTIRDVNRIGGRMNCVSCAIATDATLAGRPASALAGGPFQIRVLEDLYGARFTQAMATEDISKIMTDAGPGARGIVFGSRGMGWTCV